MFLTSPASLGDAVRSARTSAGWSQRELAEYAGMSRQHLVAVEQGKGNPTWDTVLRLTSVLGLTLELQLGTSPRSSTPEKKRNESMPSDGNIDLAALLAAHRSEHRSEHRSDK